MNQFEVIEDGKDGFIFDHEFPETFQQQFFKILELKTEDRQRISANALQKVNDIYGPGTIYLQKIKVLEKLLLLEAMPLPEFPFIRPGKKTSNDINNPGKKNLLSIVVPYYNLGKYIGLDAWERGMIPTSQWG